MDSRRRVSLFVTCIVDQLMPEVGLATVKLLRRAGYQVEFPQEQTCCGQPFFNSGFTKEAQKLAMRSIKVFEKAEAVVLPSGSCTAMIRSEYPHLLASDARWVERAEGLAAKTFELSEFLVHQAKWGSPPLTQGDPAPPEMKEISQNAADSRRPALTYHDSCHMCRRLNLKQEPRQLLEGVGYSLHEMEESDRCCGFGGLFTLRMPEVSSAMTAEKLRLASNSGAKTLATADPGCLMQMRQMPAANDLDIRHIAVLLEEATR